MIVKQYKHNFSKVNVFLQKSLILAHSAPLKTTERYLPAYIYKALCYTIAKYFDIFDKCVYCYMPIPILKQFIYTYGYQIITGRGRGRIDPLPTFGDSK